MPGVQGPQFPAYFSWWDHVTQSYSCCAGVHVKVEHRTLSGRVCDVEGNECYGCYFDDDNKVKKDAVYTALQQFYNLKYEGEAAAPESSTALEENDTPQRES